MVDCCLLYSIIISLVCCYCHRVCVCVVCCLFVCFPFQIAEYIAEYKKMLN